MVFHENIYLIGPEIPHVCRTRRSIAVLIWSRLSHFPWVNGPNKVTWGVQILKFLIIYFSTPSCYFFIGSKYSVFHRTVTSFLGLNILCSQTISDFHDPFPLLRSYQKIRSSPRSFVTPAVAVKTSDVLLGLTLSGWQFFVTVQLLARIPE